MNYPLARALAALSRAVSPQHRQSVPAMGSSPFAGADCAVYDWAKDERWPNGDLVLPVLLGNN